MRVLIISYSYFPLLSARAFRWTAIANNWAEKGIAVDVVCSGSISEVNSDKENLNVHYVKDVSSRFEKDTGDGSKKKSENSPSLKQNSKKIFISIVKKFIDIFRWPDGTWFWIRPGYLMAKQLILENKYDAVVSVALPFSSHIIALLLKLKKNNITWITDFGDPFSINDTTYNNDFLFSRFNKYMEKKVIQDSGKVSVTTAETITEYTNKLKVQKEVFYVMPPIFDLDYLKLYRNINRKIIKPKNTIKIVYTGAFHKGIREPNFILEVFSKLQKLNFSKKIELHLYGKLNECTDIFEQEYNDCDWLFLKGEVSKSDLMSVYASSHVLLNIGNQTTYQLPSKIIEYLCTGLPILNFISIEEDLSRKALKDYPAAKTISKSDALTKKYLNDLFLFMNENKELNQEKLDLIIEKYSVEKISEQYIDLF